jgi:hypothetical protein
MSMTGFTGEGSKFTWLSTASACCGEVTCITMRVDASIDSVHAQEIASAIGFTVSAAGQ